MHSRSHVCNLGYRRCVLKLCQYPCDRPAVAEPFEDREGGGKGCVLAGFVATLALQNPESAKGIGLLPVRTASAEGVHSLLDKRNRSIRSTAEPEDGLADKQGALALPVQVAHSRK